MSDRCPTWKLACSVAYRRRGCRCTPCKTHRAAAERQRLRNRRMEALDALTNEFIVAVRIDPHYVTDFAKAFHTSRR